MLREKINKEWLNQKYIIEKLSQRQIAKLCGFSNASIFQWMKKYNILARPTAEATHLRIKNNHCSLPQEAIQFIEGELLGDGCLVSRSPYSSLFQYGSKYLEYIEYIKNTLDSFGIKQSGKILKQHYEDMDCIAYHYRSLSYPELVPIRNRWYPNNKKIVPKDLRLTPLMIRQWYIGDGSLVKPKRWENPHIMLATCGFTILEVECLVARLIQLGFNATRQLSGNRIRVSTESTKDFLDYIGNCPVECYDYKFKIK